MRDINELFKQRVGEEEVARVLDMISTLPNRRDHPKPGDQQGEYDFWFDGGACTVHTGWHEYEFSDGTVAIVGEPVPALSVTISFADGRRVTIQQESQD